MNPYYQDDYVTIFCGDCREVVPTLGAVDAVVTDPPYGLGFMGKAWDHAVPGVEFWRVFLGALKPGGHCLAFAGTRTQHRMDCAIEDAGFEIRDMIAWVYGSGFPKSLDVSKAIDKAQGVTEWAETTPNPAWRKGNGQGAVTSTGWAKPQRPPKPVIETDAARNWEGWGTALKPAIEPITVARKPIDGTVAANVLRHGTGAINVDGCRVAHGEVLQRMSGKAILGGSSDGWDRPWKNDAKGLARRQAVADAAIEKANELGRWPANLIHDGSAEVVVLFPVSSTTGNRSARSQNEQVCGTVLGIDNHRSKEHTDTVSAARFFYCAKANKRDRDDGCEERNHHPTVKPTDLMRYLCRLVTPPGGVILDPFAGSGSTGKAAILGGFRAILIEKDEESCAIAAARCRHASANKQPTLFDADLTSSQFEL